MFSLHNGMIIFCIYMQECSVHSLIRSYTHLHAIFDLHAEFLYAGTICMCNFQLWGKFLLFRAVPALFLTPVSNVWPHANWAMVTSNLTVIIEGTLIHVMLVESFLYIYFIFMWYVRIRLVSVYKIIYEYYL